MRQEAVTAAPEVVNPDDLQAIADFARDRLGCQCDPEVFRSIGLDAGSVASHPFVRIVIGQRLLIWLAPGPAPADLAAAGIRERDAHGYNRFRLVLAQSGPEAEAQFRSATSDDAKAHLHIVPESSWPPPARNAL